MENLSQSLYFTSTLFKIDAIWNEQKKIEKKEMSTHPHPGGRKNTGIVHRIYIEATCEVKENTFSHIIIE